MFKEAYLYQKLENHRVNCHLCSHHCTISEGGRGVCGVRENQDGTLYSLVYGKAIDANPDPIEKKPLYHFLAGTQAFSIATVGCNFHCAFCQNWQTSQYINESRIKNYESRIDVKIPGENLSPEQIVSVALETGCQSIAYTYTEPTIFFEYAYDTAKLAQKAGLKNVFVTNGYQTPETIEKMAGVIDAANIDLKSFSDDFYQKVCGARLQSVLDSIKLMHQRGIWIEITTLIVPGQNDSKEELTGIAEFLVGISADIPWHISRFHPDYQMDGIPATPIETIHQAVEIGKSGGLKFVYTGNLPGDRYENTFCPKCQELVIERFGYQIKNNLKENDCPKCGEKIAGCF